MRYFSVAVLGRVDEKCAQHEQPCIHNHPTESTDTLIAEPSVDEALHQVATDLPVQELQPVDVTTELVGQATAEKSQG